MRQKTTAAARWLGGRRVVMPLTARVICARIVRQSALFFARELWRPPGVYVYALRASGLSVAIRHRGTDSATLAEVFHHRYYEPPAPVAQALGEPVAILDLGANVGLFGVFAAHRWPHARITGYEPDPASATLHERTISANGLASRWSLNHAAAGARDGHVRFAAGLSVDSHVIEEGAAETPGALRVRVDDVLDQIACADLVKMDIEGGEWEILHDPRFAQRPPRAVVLEYHPRGCPSACVPRSAAQQALERAGLRTRSIWHGRDGHGMLWGWRR